MSDRLTEIRERLIQEVYENHRDTYRGIDFDLYSDLAYLLSELGREKRLRREEQEPMRLFASSLEALGSMPEDYKKLREAYARVCIDASVQQERADKVVPYIRRLADAAAARGDDGSNFDWFSYSWDLRTLADHIEAGEHLKEPK
jgi:hypothetical protein